MQCLYNLIPDRLLAHASYHTGKTAFPCSSCSASYSRKCRLVTHTKKAHGGDDVADHDTDEAGEEDE